MDASTLTFHLQAIKFVPFVKLSKIRIKSHFHTYFLDSFSFLSFTIYFHLHCVSLSHSLSVFSLSLFISLPIRNIYLLVLLIARLNMMASIKVYTHFLIYTYIIHFVCSIANTCYSQQGWNESRIVARSLSTRNVSERLCVCVCVQSLNRKRRKNSNNSAEYNIDNDYNDDDVKKFVAFSLNTT